MQPTVPQIGTHVHPCLVHGCSKGARWSTLATYRCIVADLPSADCVRSSCTGGIPNAASDKDDETTTAVGSCRAPRACTGFESIVSPCLVVFIDGHQDPYLNHKSTTRLS